MEIQDMISDMKKLCLLLLVAVLIMLERAWVATVLWWMLGQPSTHIALPFSLAVVGSIMYSLISYSSSESADTADASNDTIKTLTLYELIHPIGLLMLGAVLHLFF
jgi:hypothetical protein